MEGQAQTSHSYRVSGADKTSGKAVDVTIQALNEADAYRTAARQGLTVANCAEVVSGTFYDAVANDPVMQKLLGKFPQLAHRLRRFNVDDEAQLSNLTDGFQGIGHRDSLHVARLIRANRHLPMN